MVQKVSAPAMDRMHPETLIRSLLIRITLSASLLSLSGYRHKDNNTAERALRTPVIGRKNFYGSGAQWAADLAADVWTVTATAARHDIEPLSLLTDYLQACAQRGGTAPAGAGLDPFLPWTPQGRARRRSASDPRQGPGP